MMSLPESSSCFCFADDTKLTYVGEDMFSKCQEDFDELFTWAAENDLAFKVVNCVYLQVSEKCKVGLSIVSVKLVFRDCYKKMIKTSD